MDGWTRKCRGVFCRSAEPHSHHLTIVRRIKLWLMRSDPEGADPVPPGADRGEHPGSDDESEVRDVVRYARSQGFPSGSTVPTRVAAGLLDEIDRLRARVAELETVGDAMADAIARHTPLSRNRVHDPARAWRAVRGER